MLFSSLVFLYLFLPLTLAGYYFTHPRLRNYWLLFASLVFFAWGGVSYTLILIGSIVLNYCYGLLIQKYRGTPAGYGWLFAGVATNIAILATFKYLDFFIRNINEILSLSNSAPIDETGILLPVGISFYTFHSLSYLVDIYRRKTDAQSNIFDLSLYICMFSQLIAGPIIRYSDIWLQLRGRNHTMEKFTSGIERFLIGLGKKVLLANTFARVADLYFSADPGSLGTVNAWLGIICYSLQIYFDFAGYSDMAIGLGRMFGFEFMENFNFPYIARSVKEFWRRWHISLSTFFRDYVYIPLGGSKGSLKRTYVNLILVFFLTGFWHGASWSFVIWGLFHGFFMVLERLGLEKILSRAGKAVSSIYTLLVVVFAWVLFRADSAIYAMDYWHEMVSFKVTPGQWSMFFLNLDSELILALIIAITGSSGFFNLAADYLKRVSDNYLPGISIKYNISSFVTALFLGVVLILSTLYLIAGTYNPFIYYRF